MIISLWLALLILSRIFKITPILWVCLLPISGLITLICWWTNPIACLFVTTTNGRDDLIWLFKLWQTHDNHVDEYWYGNYGKGEYTLTQYKRSWWIRYKYRILWLKRNTGYGWAYLLISLPKGEGFQCKGTHWIPFGYHNDYNFGWKAHKNIERLSYAARLLGLRK